MKAKITKFDRALVEEAGRFLRGVEEHPDATALLRRFGMNEEECARGRALVDNAERAFEWEREGRAWNFLSETPERRANEARSWYADARRRHVRSCLRRAEQAAGWVGNEPARHWPVRKKLTAGALIALRHAVGAASVGTWLHHRAELRTNLEAARGEKPVGAPPPKDSALVELAGWYENWRLLAQRVFRERPEVLAHFGLVPGKAPPRLRSRSAREKYGEKAASPSNGNGADEGAEDLVDQGLALPENKPERKEPAPSVGDSRGKSLPIL
jgi:hypothetical protein